MRRGSGAAGYLLVDVIVGLALFAFVLLAIYPLPGPTSVLSRASKDRLPAPQLPPPAVEPYAVIGTHVAAVSISLLPVSSPHPTAVAIALQEQAPTSMHRSPASFFNETVFLPQNR